MRRRGRVLIFLGLILAILTFIAAYIYLQGQEIILPTPPVVTGRVLVATQDIPARTIVPAEAVRIEERAVETIPPSALSDPSQVQGKYALVPIFTGQPIVQGMIIDKFQVQQTGSNASFAIPPGKVAYAIPLTDQSSVARAIQAGDFVDVLVTVHFKVLEETLTQQGTAETELGDSLVVQLTLQDVEVLWVGIWGPIATPTPTPEGQAAAPPPPDFITLLVPQQDALVLKYLREDPAASVDFALRGVEDHTQVTTESVTLDYLLERFSIEVPSSLPRVLAPPGAP